MRRKKQELKKKITAACCRLFTFGVSLLLAVSASGQLNVAAAEALVKRVVPSVAHRFAVAPLSSHSKQDAFELECRNGKIILRGTNGVAVASGLYYYLTHYAHCQITWNGTNLKLPEKLPVFEGRVYRETPYQYRYNLNYCTFSYSMNWWNWERCQKEIDWMALHGINMPLAITGQEYTWYEVYREMGFSEKDLKEFFCGPAYFGWFWMGNRRMQTASSPPGKISCWDHGLAMPGTAAKPWKKKRGTKSTHTQLPLGEKK